jgi:predicted O-linked N-acetylglucosamine transferase (SPINDLY family)
MGLPCITLEGDVPPARAGAAVLRRIGIPEFVATSTDEYIAKAISLANSPAQLIPHREHLRESVRSAWCQNEHFMREFETFLLSI